MDQKLMAKLFSNDEDVRKEAIMQALHERDRREAEYDREEEAERQEEKSELDAEKAEAASLKLSVLQLRKRKHDDLNKIVMKTLDGVAPREIRWLWPGKIPLGKVTLFSGDPDQGKSYVTLDIATRVSRGLSWPGEEAVGEGSGKEGGNAEHAPLSTGTCAGLGPDEVLSSQNTLPVQAPALSNKLNIGSVIIITSEDNHADTIRPRLDAMNADLTKIPIASGITREAYSAQFSVTRDLDLLERAIKKLGDCKLVVIDPLASYLQLNAGGASSIRQALDPLNELAERTGVAVILVNHLSKGTGAALYRSLGSVSIVGLCRTAWAFTRDKADRSRRMMLPIKNNLSPDDSGFAFSILDGRVEWESEPVEMTIDEAMRGERRPTRVPFALNQAVEWLQLYLGNGTWKSVSDIERFGNNEGFSLMTLRRAKRLLKVESQPAYSHGPWQWRLPLTAV